MSKVFVLDTNKQPLNPVRPGYARLLLTQGKAAVFKRYPFTIILKTVVEYPVLEPLRIKIDPGSKMTGLALLNDATGEVVFAAELTPIEAKPLKLLLMIAEQCAGAAANVIPDTANLVSPIVGDRMDGWLLLSKVGSAMP